ncbi:MAG: conjugal transfer protein TraF [Pseudomonadota bacterium]
MQKRLLTIAVLSVIASSPALAQYATNQVGQANSRGKLAISQDFSSVRNNPASAAWISPAETTFDYNIFGPIGAGYEVGKIDSLLDELDELIDILEQDDLSAQDALDAKERFDPFLVDAAVDGRVKAFGYASIPLFPMYFRAKDEHIIYADFHVGGSLRATVIDDEIDIVGFNDTFAINTDAAVYVKSMGLISVGLGYATQVWEYNDAQVFAGVKANINRFSLAKNIISLAGLEDGEDIGDAIEDDYENNANASFNLGLDVGIEWVEPKYQLGLSITDINEPDYDYGSLVSDCSGLTGISLDNCIVSQNAIAAGRIRGEETYTATAQATLSGSYKIGNGYGVLLGGSVDINEKNDPIGDPYQWFHVSATTFFDKAWVPELRFGYSENMAGSELSFYSVGFTLFERASLDVSWSDEKVEIDDSEAPRSALLSFSIQSKF